MAAKNKVRVARKVANSKPSFPGFAPILCLTPSTPWGDIGPYVLRDEKGRLMENLYQAAKLYPETPKVREIYSQWDPRVIWTREKETHVISEYDLPEDFDSLGYVELTNPVKGIEGKAFITPAYFKWRRDLENSPDPVRYPVGRKHRSNCIGAISDAQLSDLRSSQSSSVSPPITLLSYIEARKEIYVPLYQRLVLKSPKFQKLLLLHRKKDLLIIEVDGPHQESLEWYQKKYGVSSDFIEQDTILATEESLDIMLHDSLHPYGHGYALAELLLKS